MDIENIKCCDECYLYKQLQSFNKLFANPVTYAPIDMEKLVNREVDLSIDTFAQFEKRLFRMHWCTLVEMRDARYDKEVYNKICASIDLKSSEDYFGITRYSAFRSFFTMFLMGKMKGPDNFEDPSEEEEEEKIEELIEIPKEEIDYPKYFEDYDIFHVFTDKVVRPELYKYRREAEYLEYVKEILPYDEIISRYIRYLKEYNVSIPLWDNRYLDPGSFAERFFSQVAIYVDIIKNMRTEGLLVIKSDGPGTASYAAYLLGREYISDEPGDIGRIARAIGLIKEGKENDAQDIFLYFNCIQYFDNNYLESKDKVVIYNETIREIEGFSAVSTGAGKVLVKNVELDQLSTLVLRSSRFMFRDGQTAFPDEYRTAVICELMGIPMSESGKRVTLDMASTDFHIIDRNDPMQNRVRKDGAYKEIQGNNYKVYPGDNVIYLNDGISNLYFNRYKMDNIVESYVTHEGYFYVRTLVPERVDKLRLKDTQEIIRVFLVKKMKFKDTVFGVYRPIKELSASNMMDNKDLHIVDTGDFMKDKVLRPKRSKYDFRDENEVNDGRYLNTRSLGEGFF
jgi:hypothetical protein